MSQPPLKSTPINTNMTNEKISHLESTPINTKMPDPKPLKLQTESSQFKEKAGKE